MTLPEAIFIGLLGALVVCSYMNLQATKDLETAIYSVSCADVKDPCRTIPGSVQREAPSAQT